MNPQSDRVPFTMFGKTRLVPRRIAVDGYTVGGEEWEKELWVERGEDLYALQAPQFKGKRVLIVERSEWLRGKAVER